MADTKISSLADGSAPQDADLLPVARSTSNVRLSWLQMRTALSSLFATAAQGTDAREWTAATVTQAEAEAGTATTRRAWTAERVRQAIAAWWNGISTAAGRAIVTAADAAAQRSAMNAAASGAITVSGLTQATARLLGRTTAGTGAVEEIAVSGATLSGGVLTITSGGTPGGSTSQVQFNNGGAFAGASGITTNGTELTIASGTKTTSAPIQDLTQTWNAAGVTFTGWRLNITDSASAAGSLLFDIQIGGASRCSMSKGGAFTTRGVGASAGMRGDPSYRGAFLQYEGADCLIYNQTRVTLRSVGGFAWSSDATFPETGADVGFNRNAAGVVEINNGSAGQFRDLRLRNLIASQVVQTQALTVATLPASGSWAGGEAYVTDASSPAIGSTVAGGGSARAVVRSNGTNWIVTAIV